jgi:2-keto-3-deoxy-6-phosphogluconate aldolase
LSPVALREHIRQPATSIIRGDQMSRLLEAYRAVHEQVFVPIFVEDDYDTRALLEGCLLAGVRIIEYTLRRPDAAQMIPWIRENYPDLFLIVGSTMDNEKIIRHASRRHAQLHSIAELDAMDVDGFVSMIGWSTESIRKYSPTRLVIPTAWNLSEAFHQVAAGAHFAKIIGPSLDLLRICRADPTFGFCPMVMTGGMTLDAIPKAIGAGAMMVGSGFELMLKSLPPDVSAERVAQELTRFVEAAKKARDLQWPELALARDLDMQGWLDALPHYHPF